jgi:ATPase subunit of ABC transporter with duplicated ATPase domains
MMTFEGATGAEGMSQPALRRWIRLISHEEQTTVTEQLLSVRTLRDAFESCIVIRELSFEVSFGDCLAIIGSNGSGALGRKKAAFYLHLLLLIACGRLEPIL